MPRHWSTLVILALALVLFLGTPGVLLAAEGGHDKDDNALLSPRFDLGIWSIVVFILLYLVLRYVKLPGASAPAWVMMVEGLHKREHDIVSAKEEAEKAREEARTLREGFQAEKQKAQEESRTIVDTARRDAERLAAETTSRAKAEIQAERDRLRREIDTARDQALQGVWNQAAQLATLISAKVLQRSLSLEDHRRLVDQALAELAKPDRARSRA